jgi:hypothetical protein
MRVPPSSPRRLDAIGDFFRHIRQKSPTRADSIGDGK